MTASLLLVGAGHVLRPLGLLYKHRCFPETCHGSSPSQADNEPSCAEGIIVLLYVWGCIGVVVKLLDDLYVKLCTK